MYPGRGGRGGLGGGGNGRGWEGNGGVNHKVEKCVK